MGLIICDICNKTMGFPCDEKHECSKEDIRKYIQDLQQNQRESEVKANTIENKVKELLITLPSLESEEVTVKSQFLKDLWNAARCWDDYSSVKSGDANTFLVKWITCHRILTDAFQLFKSKSYRKGHTKLGKLRDLYERCKEAKEVLGYQDSVFDVSPEEFLE